MRRDQKGLTRSNPFEKYTYNPYHNLPASIINYCANRQQDFQMTDANAPINIRLFYGTGKGVPAQCGTFIQVIISFALFTN